MPVQGCTLPILFTVAIFRLNEAELHSPINQVWVGDVDHDAIPREGATARNNVWWKIMVTVVVWLHTPLTIALDEEE